MSHGDFLVKRVKSHIRNQYNKALKYLINSCDNRVSKVIGYINIWQSLKRKPLDSIDKIAKKTGN